MTPERIQELVVKSAEPMDDMSRFVRLALDEHGDHVTTRLNYYRFLALLIRDMRPDVALELGVEFGLASAYMAFEAAKYGGLVVGLDLNKHETPDALGSACNSYKYYVGDSTSDWTVKWVDMHINMYGPIGLVFQDSSHHYAPSVREWELYSRMLAPGAVWVCDDITPDFFEPGVDEKSMVEYFDELPGTKLKFKDVLHYGNTMGVLLT